MRPPVFTLARPRILASSLIAACAVASLGMAGCSPREPAAASAPAQAPAVLGGVDLNQPLRALGTEPFWGLEIESDTLSWSAVDQPASSGPHQGPTVQGTTAAWSAVLADGRSVSATLIATECSDGMSDRLYPLTARIELGETTYTGCAASKAWLDAAPRP